MKRRRFCFARPENQRERFGVGYPYRFYAGRTANGRVITRYDITRGVRFYYESPLLRSIAEELAGKGFRVFEVLICNAEGPFQNLGGTTSKGSEPSETVELCGNVQEITGSGGSPTISNPLK